MILQRSHSYHFQGDSSYFVHEKDDDFYKVRTIRNCCLDLLSCLIEAFGDLAVSSILTVIELMLIGETKSEKTE